MAYLPVLLLMAVGLGLGGVIILLSGFLGPKIKNKFKEEAFECGVPMHSDANQRFSVRFYLVAILFLLFDVEAIFFFPFALVFREFMSLGSFLLIEMAVFVGVLLVGYFYILKRGALDWE